MRSRTARHVLFLRLTAVGVCAWGGWASGSLFAQTPTPADQPAAAPVPMTSPVAEQDEKPELIVYLRDGRRFSGLLLKQNADEVILQIAGIPTRFTTGQIDRLEQLEPIIVRYRQLRETVGDDPEQIVNLAQWLQSRERYELALSEVQRALKIDPTNGNALRLRTLLEQQIVLKARAQKPKPDAATPAGGSDGVGGGSGGGGGGGGGRPRVVEFPVLTDPQIQLVKVYEVNLKDNPRILISRDTIARLLEKYANHPLVPITREGREAIYRKPPAEILDLMFRLQAREYYQNVEVLDQPRPFVLFREQVSRTWLLNSCATNQCHGGREAGRLVLLNRNTHSARTIYTNFYILTNFKLADGTPLIDWDQPDRSPLLQMGLPREKSRMPHPPVVRGSAGFDAFKPAFRTTEDRAFQSAVEWLKSVYRPRPKYPFEYAPLRPLTAPHPESKTPPETPKPATDKPGQAPPPPPPAKPQEPPQR